MTDQITLPADDRTITLFPSVSAIPRFRSFGSIVRPDGAACRHGFVLGIARHRAGAIGLVWRISRHHAAAVGFVRRVYSRGYSHHFNAYCLLPTVGGWVRLAQLSARSVGVASCAGKLLSRSGLLVAQCPKSSLSAVAASCSKICRSSGMSERGVQALDRDSQLGRSSAGPCYP
jgi:hypothetical protein